MIFYLLSSNLENLAEYILNNTFWQKIEFQNECFLLSIQSGNFSCKLDHEDFIKNLSLSGYTSHISTFLNQTSDVLNLIKRKCSFLNEKNLSLLWFWKKGHWSKNTCLPMEDS